MLNTLLAKGELKVSNEEVKDTLERMTMALVDAQSNLTTTQQRMKCAVHKKRRTEEYKIGDEVALSTANLWTYCPNLPPKLRHGGLALLHLETCVTNCIWIGSTPGLADPSHLPRHSKLKCYIHSGGVLEGGRAAASNIGGEHSGV